MAPLKRFRALPQDQFEIFLNTYRAETPSYSSLPREVFLAGTGLAHPDARSELQQACEEFHKLASRRRVEAGDPATVIFELSLKKVVDRYLETKVRQRLAKIASRKKQPAIKRVAIPVTDEQIEIIDRFASANKLSRSRAFEVFIAENLEQWASRKQKKPKAGAQSHITHGGRSPAVDVAGSVTDEYLVCLENGRHVKELKGYLKRVFGMSFEEYARKWNLPEDYPTMAPAYARNRAALGGAQALKAEIRRNKK